MQRNRATILASQDTLGGEVGGAIRQTLREMDIDSLPSDSLTMPAFNLKGGIEKAILSSNFVIVDLSKQNPNLMYELGYARGIRKPTILIMSEQSEASIPTDLADSFYLFYDPHDLQKFQSRLRSMVSPYVL